MRKTIHLNYDWTFVPDFKQEYLNKSDIEQAKTIDIPHTMKQLPFHYFDEESYQYIGTYNRIIEVTKEMLKKQIQLTFFGVMNIAKVYLNGTLLCIHEGGYTPFDVDITPHVVEGNNLLQVIVDSTEVKDIPPFGHLIDYLAYSGIYREVELKVFDSPYLDEIQLSTFEAASLETNEMLLHIEGALRLVGDESYTLKGEIIEISSQKKIHSFTTECNNEFSIDETIKPIKRWTTVDPELYLCKLQLFQDKSMIDEVTERFGFRTAKFTPEGFFLNNELVTLIGLNRHQSYPYQGYAMPKRMQELDAEILKEYGCNIVRTSHYMQSDHFINRCDELGILVLEEVPGWQYIGDEHFKQCTYQNIKDMIRTHINHPSIVTWGVRINESMDDHDFYEETNRLARELDPTRQTCGVRNIKKSDFLEDIYTYNDFSHTGNNPGLENPNKISKGYVPYLVTEHNGHMFPTKKFDHESRRVDQAFRHLAVIHEAHYYKRISGAIGWCLADYNTHIQFGSNDRVCYHGVMDMFRLPKTAAYAYQSQSDDFAMLEVGSNMSTGDQPEMRLPEIVVFTNCDYLKLYKNDEFVGVYYPNDTLFPYLPHPPVIINDFIGDLLINKKQFNPKLAKKISRLLADFNRNGMKLSIRTKLSFAWLLLRKKVSYSDVFPLFEEYIAMQKDAPVRFRFEGYIDDELVVSTTKGHTKETRFVAMSNTEELEYGYSYDVARISVSLQDEFENVLDYAIEGFQVETSEVLEVIGPKTLSLVGGSLAFYVKTRRKTGTGTITITPNHYPPIELKIKIKKGILD